LDQGVEVTVDVLDMRTYPQNILGVRGLQLSPQIVRRNERVSKPIEEPNAQRKRTRNSG
jgi:hypothetical protein